MGALVAVVVGGAPVRIVEAAEAVEPGPAAPSPIAPLSSSPFEPPSASSSSNSPPGAEPGSSSAPPLLTPVTPAAVEMSAALEQILRTSCAQGTTANVFARGDLSADERAVRDAVLATCRRMTASASRSSEGVDRSGRARLIFFASLYGAIAGIQAEVSGHLTFADVRYYIVPPLFGMGLGLAASVYGTVDGEITPGQTWTIISGFDYGSYLGALWAGAADADFREAMGISLALGLSAGTAAVGAAKLLQPSQGDAEIFRSGGLWGTTSGLFVSLLLSPQAESFSLAKFEGAMAMGMTLGLGTGAMVARRTELSRDRVLLIDTGALVGTLTGMSLVWLVRGFELRPRMFGAGGLAGLGAGLAFATWSTRNMDADGADDEAAILGEAPPALLVRSDRGQWRLGQWAPLPLFDLAAGGSVTRVGLEVPVVGGRF